MARINSNIASLTAQTNLARSNTDLQLRLQRLSTGLRINRGADDPAGLITSERLQSELRGIEQGVKNSERASSVIATTEGSLAEVSDLLNSIKALVVEAANGGAISPEEIKANQLQIDSAIDSITRISNTASFAGLKLLNGQLGYTLSGVDTTNIIQAKVNAANFLSRSNIQVDVEVVGSAQQAQLFTRGDFSNGAVFVPPGVDGQLISAVTLEVAGPDGVQVLTFGSNTTLDDVAAAINALSESTGVRAARVSATDITSGLRFYSTAYGSTAFVSVKKLGNAGAFFNTVKLDNNAPPSTLDYNNPAVVSQSQRDEGRDVVAIVNGALATGAGAKLAIRTNNLDLELLLTPTFSTTVDGTASTFYVTGGGSLFQLGPQVNASQQVNIGIQSIADSQLGGSNITLPDGTTEFQYLNSLKSGGANALAGKRLIAASKIIESAIDEISTLRGRLGAFERNTLQTNIRSLQAAQENVTSATSKIRDADFAAETSSLTRAQILTSAGTSVLAAANTQAQSVLQLLG